MVIDFLIILVVILSAALGFRRGFCATLLSFAAFGFSIIITLSLYSSFSQNVLETEFGKNIQLSVSRGIDKYINDTSEKTIGKLPFLNDKNANINSEKNSLHNKAVEVIMSLILLIGSYFASKLIIYIIRKILHIATGLPIIHTADSILGGACGIMLGLIWVGLIYICAVYFSLIDYMPAIKNQFNSSVLVLIISDLIP